MLFHKPKRKRGTTRRWLIVFGLLLISSLILLSSFLVQHSTSASYATQAWNDPWQICITPWSIMQPDVGVSTLQQAFIDNHFTVTDIQAMELGGHCGYIHMDGDRVISSLQHSDIRITIAVGSDALNDPVILANTLAQALNIIKEVELDVSVPNFDMLRIMFTEPDDSSLQWSMNYKEAMRAVNAGLNADALYALGDLRLFR